MSYTIRAYGSGVAVAEPAVPVPQPPVITAGDDRVTHARCRSVGQSDVGAGLQCVIEDRASAGMDVEGGDVLAGLGDQHLWVVVSARLW